MWAELDPSAKKDIYGRLYSYFDAVPRPPDWQKIESLEDLTPAVELFDKLVGLGRYEDASVIFLDHLASATHYRLSASRLRIELLERLFPDGENSGPKLVDPLARGYILGELAQAFQYSGEPGRATSLYLRAVDIFEREQNEGLSTCLNNLADVLWPAGHLWQAESTTRRAFGLSRKQVAQYQEGISLQITGTVLAGRGEDRQSCRALNRALAISVKRGLRQAEGVQYSYISQRCLWLWQPGDASKHALRAWELAHVHRVERDFIRAARMQGEAALGLGDLGLAEARLQHALSRARAVNLVEEELPALTALAELHRQRKQYEAARDRLEDVWASAERGPYVLWHADACNVLAQLEHDLGRRDAAITAATHAYRFAWCDGPPYAYRYGLTNARKVLQELGAPEPELPPFDAAKFPPMPDVELNPRDEFYVEPED